LGIFTKKACLLYKFLKIFASIGIYIYCRSIRINNKALLQSDGPILLAVNHPNSFLDATILATLFKQPIYSLARGDAFKRKAIAAILKGLHILPVYREREGAENLHLNYGTFNKCNNLFKNNGVVLIFTEALCENEWHLRPLKKGTARLAVAAWKQGVPLKILPIGINYSSFNLFGKNVHLNIGSFIQQDDLPTHENGKLLNTVTEAIHQQLQAMVYEIDSKDKTKLATTFEVEISTMKKIVLKIPAVLGYCLHFPLYFPLQKLIQKKAFKTGHYDSIMVGSLAILYPFYLLILAILCNYITGGFWWMTAFILPPFFAWSYVQLKKQTD
jgi:1-acyl-sn-glycerol-3-phosphate acyltransferase